jgi:hypothetical protein
MLPQSFTLGNFNGRTAILPTIVDFPQGHVTYTAYPMNIVTDTVVDFPGIAKSFTAYPFSILQAGYTIDFPQGHVTYTALPMTIEQTNSADVTVSFPTANLTYTAYPMTINYVQDVDFPVSDFSFTAYPMDIAITLAGPQTLTQTDINAIWRNFNIGNMTPENILEIIAAAVAGRLSGVGTNNLVFRSIDNTKDVITAHVDGGGNRIEITLTP